MSDAGVSAGMTRKDWSPTVKAVSLRRWMPAVVTNARRDSLSGLRRCPNGADSFNKQGCASELLRWSSDSRSSLGIELWHGRVQGHPSCFWILAQHAGVRGDLSLKEVVEPHADGGDRREATDLVPARLDRGTQDVGTQQELERQCK